MKTVNNGQETDRFSVFNDSQQATITAAPFTFKEELNAIAQFLDEFNKANAYLGEVVTGIVGGMPIQAVIGGVAKTEYPPTPHNSLLDELHYMRNELSTAINNYYGQLARLEQVLK